MNDELKEAGYTPVFQILINEEVDVKLSHPKKIPKEDVIAMLKDAIQTLEGEE